MNLINEYNNDRKIEESSEFLEEMKQTGKKFSDLNLSINEFNTSLSSYYRDIEGLIVERTRLQISRDILKVVKNPSGSENLQPIHLYLLEKILSDQNPNSYSEIRYHLDETKRKLLFEFKEAFWRVDKARIFKVLENIEKFNIFPECIEFYLQNIITTNHFHYSAESDKLNDVLKKIKDIFFDLTRAFEKSFSENSLIAIKTLFQKRSRNVGKRILWKINEILEVSLHRIAEIPDFNNEKVLIFEFYFNEMSEFYEKSKANPMLGEFHAEILTTNFDALIEKTKAMYLPLEKEMLYTCLSGKCDRLIQRIKKPELSPGKRTYNIVKIFSRENKKVKKLSKAETDARMKALINVLFEEDVEIMMTESQKSFYRVNNIFKDSNKKAVEEISEIFVSIVARQLIYEILCLLEETIPAFSRKSPLHIDFFEVLSKTQVLVHRVELITQNLELEIPDFDEKFNSLIQTSLASLSIHANRRILEDKKNITLCRTKKFGVFSKFVEFLSPYVDSIEKYMTAPVKKKLLCSFGTNMCSIIEEYLNNGENFLKLDDLLKVKEFFKLFKEEIVEGKFESLIKILF